jgi:hypothetical protein
MTALHLLVATSPIRHHIRFMKLDSKYFDGIRVRRQSEADARERHPVCAWPGCSLPGAHRAPRGRELEGQYLNLCIEHVREYNKSYNYFAGLDNAAVSSWQKDAVTGHRPTWRLGENSWASSRVGRTPTGNSRQDPFNFMGQHGRTAAGSRAPMRTARNAELKALHSLGLEDGATAAEIRAQYKVLVKRLHPDANAGSRDNEDKLKEIIESYDYLRASGYC